MLDKLFIVLTVLFNFLIENYMFCTWTEKKYKITKRIVMFGFMIGLVYVITDYYFSVIIRSIIFNITELIIMRILYNEKWSKNILCQLFIFLCFAMGESLVTIILMIILNTSMEEMSKYTIGLLFSNLIIIFTVLLLVKIRFIKRLIINIIKWYEENKIINIIIFPFLAFVILEYLMYQNFIGIKSITYLVILNLFLIGIFIFIIGFFKERSRNNELLYNYDSLFGYVKTYEKIAIEKSKRQHEFKNQLILIKEMIEVNDEKCLKYIDNILKLEAKEKNKHYIDKLVNIPEGGLKGFILFKIDKMIENGVNVTVNISPELNNKAYWKTCDKELQDISRAIGVYIDNAHEAALETEKKFVIIDIDYIERYLIFTFSNTYSNKLNFSRIGKEGYSTKGKHRGHGLSMINEIIGKNKKLEQEKEINSIYYVQKLKIKNQE